MSSGEIYYQGKDITRTSQHTVLGLISCSEYKEFDKKDTSVLKNQRTEIKSFLIRPWTVALATFSLAFIIYLEQMYHAALLEFTFADNGTPYLQSLVNGPVIKAMKIQTNLGSGLEMIILCVGAFVWSSRPKFFYYLTMFCIDRALTCMIKLTYAQPRPYLENLKIKAYQCPTEFGNPSGHSSASMGVAIVLFLDVFHGQTRGVLKFYSWTSYCASLVFAIYWLVSIPITRIVLGVHSFDQVVFGSTLGVWNGLLCHFLLRDNLIAHIQGALVNSNSSQNKSLKNKKQYAMVATAYCYIYTIASIVVYYNVEASLAQGTEIDKWDSNYVKQCNKPVDPQFPVVFLTLLGCSIQVHLVTIYLCCLFRSEYSQFYPGGKLQVHDGATIGKEDYDWFINGIKRLLLIYIVFLIVTKPRKWFNLDVRLGHMSRYFVNLIIPMFISGVLLVGGPYDYCVGRIQREQQYYDVIRPSQEEREKLNQKYGLDKMLGKMKKS